jgi:hypothetical protein
MPSALQKPLFAYDPNWPLASAERLPRLSMPF